MTVLSPELSTSLQEDVSAGRLCWIQESYRPEHLEGFAFVIAATSDAEINADVATCAEQRGILSSVASSGKLSRVIFPARHERHGVTVAVHSHGTNCRRSQQVRDDIAALLDQEEQLVVGAVCIRRADISGEAFRWLGQIDAGQWGSQAIVLKTCCRWECYFASDQPRHIAREVRSHLQAGGIDRSSMDLLMGDAARHHLLRILCGLDSPLLGETEIIGQARTALDGSDLPAGHAIRDFFADALRQQKHIRRSSGLQRINRRWTSTIAGWIAEQSPPHVDIVGAGSLGRSFCEWLDQRGQCRRWFSGRDALGDDSILPTASLIQHLQPGDVVVLCSPLPPEIAQTLADRAETLDLHVVDMEGGHDTLGIAADRYTHSLAIRPPLDGTQVDAIAQAATLIMQHTVAMHQPSTHPPSEPLRLIARSSALSRRQVVEATTLLEIATGSQDMEIRWTETPGDRNQEACLNDSPGDFFTRDLDAAILEGQADLALHSAKDLPSPLPEGLLIGAMVPSIAEWECLVTPHSATLSDLPAGAVIGVSCDRRRDGLARLRPDLIAKPIRGSVPDRIDQMDRGDYDGLLLAAVGLIRLGLSDRISQVFSRDELPSPQGQGSLAMVIRSDDEPLRRILCPLNLARREVAHGTR